ncbi:disulfide bond formation protein B [Tautonia sp. JC769]|uniref:disulfide bond formation protein B n=1 Tax=Tautonia sp. JC769 TaxID=3232135 RepID=UPI003459EDFF
MKANFWTRLALAVASAMLAGSLFLSIGMGLKACPLCLYERTFVMGVVGLLVMGMAVLPVPRPGSLAPLALPMAVAGLSLAGFHVYLDRSGVLDCPAGILGIGHAPDQSLAGYLLLTTALVLGVFAAGRAETGGGGSWAVVFGGVVLGGLLAFACIKSAPPLPPPNPTYGPSGERILSGCEPAVPEEGP